MINVFSVMSKKTFEVVTGKFNSKEQLSNGDVVYSYYGASLSSKSRYDSVFYSVNRILEGELYDLSCGNINPKYNNIEELLDMNDSVVVRIVMDDNDRYGSDLIMYYVGDCDDIDGAMALMDKVDPAGRFKIGFNTRISFVLNYIYSNKDYNRSISIERQLYGYNQISIVSDNAAKMDESKYIVNINNLKKVLCIDMRSLFTDSFIKLSNNDDSIKEIVITHVDYAVNICRMDTYAVKRCISSIPLEMANEILDDVIELIPIKERNSIFNMLPEGVISDNISKIADAIYNAKYTYLVVEFFMNFKNKIDTSRIDRKRFIKASSLAKYNELMQYESNPQITFMADSINQAGTILSERIMTLACFVNMYSEEEFKELELNSLADAIVNKLVSRFTYELNTDINILLGDRTENMQYLCDLVIKRMTEGNYNSVSRVKLIKDNSRNTNSIYGFLNKSIDNSDEPKILRAILKIGI